MSTAVKTNKKGKAINVVLFILFFLFAIVQLNDPDPILWFSIYFLTAILCLTANYKSIPKKILWILVIAFLLFALYHFSYFMDWIKIDHKEELFGEMVYKKPYLEGTREFLGLLIAAGALFYQIKSTKNNS